jgi:hypothetical protein
MIRRVSRLRRILEWVGLLACVAIAIAWIIAPRRPILAFGSFELHVVRGWQLPRRLASIEHIDDPQYRLGAITRVISEFYVPYWLVFLCAATPTAYLFWRDQRPPKGHCQSCGYDPTDNTSGVCPECGELR